MKRFTDKWTRENVASYMRRQSLHGTYNGEMNWRNQMLVEQCTATYQPDGLIMIFTRDVGHHSSGWWKNPDYERCWHLSLSYRDPSTGHPVERDKKNSALWVTAFFEEKANLVWVESPYSPEGKRGDVYHYRVFFADGWVAPILPRKEVYSKDYTPANWQSWSDQKAQDQREIDTWLESH